MTGNFNNFDGPSYLRSWNNKIRKNMITHTHNWFNSNNLIPLLVTLSILYSSLVSPSLSDAESWKKNYRQLLSWAWDDEIDSKKNPFTIFYVRTNYLKKIRNNASPGNSGFTGEFFKFFWRDLKQFIVSSANYSFQIGSLSISQKLGIITLLPKGSKDKRFIKNWRPITLLNTFYKLISGLTLKPWKGAFPNQV